MSTTILKNPNRLFIFAGSHQEASEFAKSKNLPHRVWKYLHHPDQLRGVPLGVYILVIGTWYMNNHSYDIELIAKQRKAVWIDNPAAIAGMTGSVRTT